MVLIILASKTGAYHTEALSDALLCGSLGPSLTHKYKTRLEKTARNKQSRVLRTFVNYGFEFCYNIGPRDELPWCTGMWYPRRAEVMKRMVIMSQILLPFFLAKAKRLKISE
jgi:hypothetical protein